MNAENKRKRTSEDIIRDIQELIDTEAKASIMQLVYNENHDTANIHFLRGKVQQAEVLREKVRSLTLE